MLFSILFSGFGGTPVCVLVAVAFFWYFYHTKKFLEIMVLFWYCTMLSDTRHFDAVPYYTAKMVIIILMTVGLFNSKNFGGTYSKFFSPFMPFFLIAFIAMFFGFDVFTSFQKTLSYLAVMLTFPTYILAAFRREGGEFVRKYVLAGALVLFVGAIWYIFGVPYGFFASKYFDDSLFDNATQAVEANIADDNAGRFNGMFGNPNGMGIYSLTFFVFFTVCRYYYKEKFSKYETISLYTLTLLSCIWSASRGGLFAIIIFLLFYYLSKKTTNTVAFFLFVLMVLSYQVAIIFVKDIFEALGLSEQFRTGDIEKGSGRLIAVQYLWEKIQENFFFSKGWGYTEYLFIRDQHMLNGLGHQGGAHNSFLQVWGDLGLVGLVAFLFGWGSQFWSVASKSRFAIPMMLAFMFSGSVESWLIGSLNPWLCVLISLLAFFNIKAFIDNPQIQKQKILDFQKNTSNLPTPQLANA
jgi:O-antigen ligase